MSLATESFELLLSSRTRSLICALPMIASPIITNYNFHRLAFQENTDAKQSFSFLHAQSVLNGIFYRNLQHMEGTKTSLSDNFSSITS